MCLSEVTVGKCSKLVSSLSSVGRCCCLQAEIGDGTPEARTLEVSVSNEAVDYAGRVPGHRLEEGGEINCSESHRVPR